MKLHELHSPAGSRRNRKRIGRGISAGQGKTSGRGQKGAGAREGAKTPRAFEGGQMKITQRLPKLRGFANRWRVEYTVINVSKLNRFPSGAIVDGAALASRGLLSHPGERVKLLAAGRVKAPVTVRVHRASAAAQRAVEAAGGRVELLESPTVTTARAPKRGRAADAEPVAIELIEAPAATTTRAAKRGRAAAAEPATAEAESEE